MIVTTSPTRNGPCWSLCCRIARLVGLARGVTAVGWSTGCCGELGRGHRGATCRSPTAVGRPSTTVTDDGPRTAPGPMSSLSCSAAATWPRRSGWWRSTRPSCERTTTRPSPVTGHRATCRRRCWRLRWPGPRPPRWPVPVAMSRPAGASQGAESNHTNPQQGQDKPRDHEALGRSRGGLSTKIHLLADARCRPIATVTTAGQRHDSLAFELVMDKVCLLRPGRGRPRRRPDEVQADKAYSSKAIRGHLRGRGIRATIPLKADQQPGPETTRNQRSTTCFRPHRLQATQRRRTRRKQLRGTRAVSTRYDQREFVYRGTIDVAAIRIWLRDPVPTDMRDTP
jgi:transposase